MITRAAWRFFTVLFVVGALPATASAEFTRIELAVRGMD
jgi:hypothetical protein